MTDNILQTIQEMQYTDRSAAEALLVGFIGRTFPLDVHSVQLRPSAISLQGRIRYATLIPCRFFS